MKNLQKGKRFLYPMLKQVAKRSSLHMPGTQGKSPFGKINVYNLDTTEISLTDDLYAPFGAIVKAETVIAKEANAQASLLLTGGATAGIHAMLRYSLLPGDTVFFTRNVHKSALHAAINFGINVVWLPVNYQDDIPSYSLKTLSKAIQNYPHAKAMLLVRPDYYGNCPDILDIALTLHKHNMLLLVDEAHGAHFNWLPTLKSAMECHADLSVQSAHKTLPALTGSAWLHANNKIDSIKLRQCLNMVQTSSPSFIIMQSLDDARAYLQGKGQKALLKLCKEVAKFKELALQLGYKSPPFIEGQSDPLRVVLYANQGGYNLAKQLENKGLDVEMADDKRIVCILSLLSGKKRLKQLLKALKSIKQTNSFVVTTQTQSFNNTSTPLIPLAKAYFMPKESIPLNLSVNRIACSQVGLYPPGISLITAGEQITDEFIKFLQTQPIERLFGLSENGTCIDVIKKECTNEYLSL